MELQRLPRRSASHGTLRSNYTRHARPLHKPLRSVNENAALLPSPGALESMLKTTTETGDIGLFSIKPFPGSNLGLSSGGRCPTGTTEKSLPQPHRSVDEAYGPDSHKMLPSYRDTTLDIISMYGSNSQSSVASTLGPSTEEPNQRSYSMTTVGSKYISHKKSSTTLMNPGQPSAGPLQRPRSPFPYPTRLKRPGARPASPAVTDAGIVDYSRMVEIDRISLRTGNGSFKSSRIHGSRRPPPLGLRSDANLSTPSLPGRGPPSMRHPPGASSMRTISAASGTSWNAPYRERLNSNSTRTSSLTSVVNMYHRMPPALRTAQFGPPIPPPRYYDYTEEFERGQSRSTTPVHPLAPVPTRAPSVQRASVLRDNSEEQLDAALGVDPDSAFFEEESEQDDSQVLMESGILGYRQEADDQENYEHSSARPQPPCTESENTIGASSSSSSVIRQMRGSDIDLLPSQIGRASVDTFRPSLDVESREIPLFSYPNYRTRKVSKDNTPSPARQVQVHRGRTPTIRSEQGVILKDDVQEGRPSPVNYTYEEPPRQVNTPTIAVQSPNKWRSMSDNAHDLFIATTEPAKLCPRSNLDFDNLGERSLSSDNDTQDLLEIVKSPKDTITTGLSRMTRSEQAQSACNSHGQATTSGPKNGDAPKVSTDDRDQFRRHRRNQATLEIVTKNLPQDDDDVDHPLVTPQCSTAPLISPKPISPARELKVRNSIPQLMKALPLTPSEPGYVPLTTTTTMDGEEYDDAEVLLPYNLTRSEMVQHPRTCLISKPDTQSSCHSRNPLPELQKKLPKIRLKTRDTNTGIIPNPRDSRPWTSDSNHPWCNKAIETELGGMGGDKDNNDMSFKQKLRLKGPRTVCSGTPPLGTVRHHPEARGSEIVANLANQQSKNLFNFSNSLTSALRQVSRKFSHSSHDVPPTETSGSPKGNIAASWADRQSTTVVKRPQIVLKNRQLSGVSSDRYSSMKRRQGLKKHLSNLRGLLPRSSHTQLRVLPKEEVDMVLDKGRDACVDNTFGLGDIHVESKHFTTNITHQPQYKRRIRARISKWARDTKAAVKHYGRRDRRVDGATRGGSRNTI